MWKVTLSKVSAEEFSLYPTIMDAIVAAQELEEGLGIRNAKTYHLSVKQSPVTGELLIVDVSEVQDGL